MDAAQFKSINNLLYAIAERLKSIESNITPNVYVTETDLTDLQKRVARCNIADRQQQETTNTTDVIKLVSEHLAMGATKWKPVHKMIPNDTAVVLEGHLLTTMEVEMILQALKK